MTVLDPAAVGVAPEGADRKRLGAWYTPEQLVHEVVDAVVTSEVVARVGRRAVRVLDPACGDGRFLDAVANRLRSLGARCELVGIDVDPVAIAATRRRVPDARLHLADALDHDTGPERFDLVVGNPPFLSQLASATTRGGSSRWGGGPYADVAVEFLALAARAVDPDGGRVALVLPQSVLSARDAAPVRARVDAQASMIWSSWSDERWFDAQVYTCALAFEFGRPDPHPRPWTHVVTGRNDVPDLPALRDLGVLGDRARFNANFRDEYYGMVPGVGDHATGPPLVTSGLIDPGVCHWGRRPITFARRRFEAPRIDVDRLTPAMRRWAEQRLVPKVLIANQTRIVEAVADPDGEWLPGVPVVAAYPTEPRAVWEVAAVLTSPVASAWVWHRRAGTGLSARSVRVGPAVLAESPWPAGSLADAVTALRAGDVPACAAAVMRAFGCAGDDALLGWWMAALDRINARR